MQASAASAVIEEDGIRYAGAARLANVTVAVAVAEIELYTKTYTSGDSDLDWALAHRPVGQLLSDRAKIYLEDACFAAFIDPGKDFPRLLTRQLHYAGLIRPSVSVTWVNILGEKNFIAGLMFDHHVTDI